MDRQSEEWQGLIKLFFVDWVGFNSLPSVVSVFENCTRVFSC